MPPESPFRCCGSSSEFFGFSSEFFGFSSEFFGSSSGFIGSPLDSWAGTPSAAGARERDPVLPSGCGGYAPDPVRKKSAGRLKCAFARSCAVLICNSVWNARWPDRGQSTSDSGAALSAGAVSSHRCQNPSEILCASAATAPAKALRFQSPKNHSSLIRKQLISDSRHEN